MTISLSIGGHSLKAMMMTAKIQEHFQKEVPIKVLFEKPTIQRAGTVFGRERKQGGADV
jgi:acyl carrier protein